MRKILIADASEEWRELLEQALGAEYRVQSCSDGLRVPELVDGFGPEVLILDLMLPGSDGLCVIKALDARAERPRMIVTGRYFSNFINAALERYQVDCAMLKPCTVQSVVDRVRELLLEGQEVGPISLDPYDYITGLLVSLGAPTSQQGFRLLRRGILLLIENPDQQLTKNLYPDLAKEFSTSPANVEKALRTTVTTAWSRRRDDVWRNYFPQSFTGQIPKPTAGQFLLRLSDAVRSVLRQHA